VLDVNIIHAQPLAKNAQYIHKARQNQRGQLSDSKELRSRGGVTKGDAERAATVDPG